MVKNTEHVNTDVFIAGGGLAGLIAAQAFAQAGFSVICAEPNRPVTERGRKGADLRTTAFLQPAQQFLDSIGLWPDMAPQAMALERMRIVDAGAADAADQIRLQKDFDARDISAQPFGWNVPNWFSRKVILAALEAHQNVEFLSGVACTSYFSRVAEARVSLNDGRKLRAKLVLAADGRHSLLRKAAGISCKTRRFGQKALAFAVTHPIPHQNISTEMHRSGGPFTLVPLPDHESMPSSAVVWMETGPEAARLMALSDKEFEEALDTRSCGLLGPLKLASARTLWPIISQIAERLSAQRLALIAEAAHVVPPIGAQGLNMSLADIESLCALAQASPDTLGDEAMLEAYHKARIGDLRTRVAGISMLNQASMADHQILRDLRAGGLNALHGIAPVRRAVMNLGLGAKSQP